MIKEAAIVKLEPRHAAITPFLRRADAEEIWAGTGLDPALAVCFSICSSEPGWAAELRGEPIAVFGARRAGPGIGIPWLLTTDAIERYPVHFYRVSKGIIEEIKRRYGLLVNWVHADNKLSVRWLDWAGFEIEPAAPMGPRGRLFHRFTWRADSRSRP
jgi:hypothetical protein